MKVKIEVDKDITPEQASELLSKALKAKSKLPSSEKYHDPAIEEFANSILKRHEKIVNKVLTDIVDEVNRHVDR